MNIFLPPKPTINPGEVRIGNWVRRAGSHEPKMITVEDFWRYYQDAITPFYYYEPILLTPEILLACGFVKNEETLFILHLSNENYTDSIHIHEDGGWWYAIDKLLTNDDYGSLNREIKHLHQLQNLYFSLTGKELLYKPVSEKASDISGHKKKEKSAS